MKKKKRVKRKISALKRKQGRYGYLFTFPLCFGLVFMFIIPVCQTLLYSVNEMTLTNNGIHLSFNGLENFRQVLMVDPFFKESVILSVRDMLINILLIAVFSFFMATLLNQKFHGRAVVRVVFFMTLVLASPVVLNFDSGNAMAYIVGNSGAGKGSEGMAGAIRSVNLAPLLVAGGIPQAFVSYLLAAADRVYETVVLSGVQTLIFLAALQSVPSSLYEACDMEGATGWEKYWMITFPMVKPMLVLVLVYTIIDSFATSSTIDMIQSKMFDDIKFGPAAAMSVVYFLMISLIVGLTFFLTRKLAADTN